MDRMHSTYMGRAAYVHKRAVERHCFNFGWSKALTLAHGVSFMKDEKVNSEQHVSIIIPTFYLRTRAKALT